LGPGGKAVLAAALIAQGYTMLGLHDLDAVQSLSEETLTLSHQLQDAWTSGHALNQLGNIDWYRGDLANAQRRFLESFACFQADGNSVMRGSVLYRLGETLYEQGDYAAAYGHLTQSLAIFEEPDDKTRGSNALRQLGYLAMLQGNYEDAQKFLARALTFAREVGDSSGLIKALILMGRLAQCQGDYPRAHALHRESLILCLETGQQGYVSHLLEAFACLAAAQEQAERAGLLFGAADTGFAATDVRFDLPSPWRDPNLRTEHDRLVAETRVHLGEATFAAAWAKGQAMTLQQAVEYALMPAQM
jgi:tetratricopeptide (TPR) repeat protein